MYITILVKQVYWYISQVSGERLQDHWSSGSDLFLKVNYFCKQFILALLPGGVRKGVVTHWLCFINKDTKMHHYFGFPKNSHLFCLRFYCEEVILCLLTEAKPKDETPNFPSTRDYYKDDQSCYIMDAKSMGNIGRYLNVSSKNTKIELLHKKMNNMHMGKQRCRSAVR